MKVLLIGYTGMLGQELKGLFQKKYDLISWNRQDIDITNEKSAISKICGVSPDIIINASAFNDVDGAEKEPELKNLSLRVNYVGVKNLAEAARKTNSFFIHYSTDYVFDGKEKKYHEFSQTCPISNHGKAKEKGEKAIENIGGKYFIIRLSRLFGEISKSPIGKESFFDKLIKLSKTKKSLEVVSDEISCFTYAPDLAISTKRLIEENYPFGIYHLVNEGGMSWYKGAKRLFKILQINTELIPVSGKKFQRPAKRPSSSILINTKFPKLRTFEDAIREWVK